MRRVFRQHWSHQVAAAVPFAAVLAGMWQSGIGAWWGVAAAAVTVGLLRPRLVVDAEGFTVTQVVGRTARHRWVDVEDVTSRVARATGLLRMEPCVVVVLRSGPARDRLVDLPWLSTTTPWGPLGRARLEHSLRVADELRRCLVHPAA